MALRNIVDYCIFQRVWVNTLPEEKQSYHEVADNLYLVVHHGGECHLEHMDGEGNFTHSVTYPDQETAHDVYVSDDITWTN